MHRKLIIDCDPGIDAAVALAWALFEPQLEVVAVTAVEGCVSAELATRNVQALIEQLDPPRFPRMGAASPADDSSAGHQLDLNGEDGLGELAFQVSQLARQYPSERLLADEIRKASGEITVLCLGPLTNVARALLRDPDLTEHIGRLVVRGGAAGGVGNATPAAEFNIFYDPTSASDVFRSPITKTIIPLDVTQQNMFGLDLLGKLPTDTRPGALLHQLLSYSFRAHRERLGLEGQSLHSAVALAAVLHPELFATRELVGDVETEGRLTRGATIFDRRHNAPARGDLEVALEADSVALADCIVRGLTSSGRST